MRPLKFRAFNNNVLGVPFTLEEISTFEVNSDRIGATWPEGTVFMQFTGLLDKNGREIYEGDFIEAEDFYYGIPFKGVVEFENGCFSVTQDGMTAYRWLSIKCEIVGNIYENPELLKQ